MTLDLSATYFPNPNRDDFGVPWGLLTANYTWNISQRTTVLANALYDTFPGAEQLWNVGIMSQRSERGSVYLGLAQVKGDFGVLDSDIVTASYSYQMSRSGSRQSARPTTWASIATSGSRSPSLASASIS